MLVFCSECVECLRHQKKGNELIDTWLKLCVNSPKGKCTLAIIGYKDALSKLEYNLEKLEKLGYLVTTEAPGQFFADKLTIKLNGFQLNEDDEMEICINRLSHVHKHSTQ